MKTFLLTLLILPVCTFAKARKENARELTDNNKIEIMAQLIQQQNLSFDSNNSTGCNDESIGKYLSRLTALALNTSESKNSFKVVCKEYNKNEKSPLPPPDKQSTDLDCKLTASSTERNGFSQSAIILFFRMSSDLKSLNKNIFGCNET
ncbi:MAG: hypothetical protein HUU56_14155 [Bdellovibrionaceae bacterium]|nr:hypothetical protein [Pseudobdellovibrionaceae bacterium]